MGDAPDKPGENRLQLFRTLTHPCPYLPDREARNLVLDPEAEKNPFLYGYLAEHGFRRNGNEIYRPDCALCHDCIPVRVPVRHFIPRRSQRRIWHNHLPHTRAVSRPPVYDDEHFHLFRRYLRHRHPEGEMAASSPDDYRRFLLSSWCDTSLIEFRRGETLIGVAVTDYLPKGLSAVYTFFDPAWSRESPGVFSVLWQIEEARRLGLLWLYLGFWIPGCRKMAYKEEYRPLQLFFHDHEQECWKEFSPKAPIRRD